MRMVRQRVLPLPAPALTSSGEPGAASTASRCAASSASSAAASAMSTAPAPLLENTEGHRRGKAGRAAARHAAEEGQGRGKAQRKRKRKNSTFKHFPRPGLSTSALLLRCCEMKTDEGVRFPFPFIFVASTKRISPPTLVHAKPVATPGTLVRSATSLKKWMGPRISSTSAASTTTGASRLPDAISRAHQRHTAASSRFRERTPDSRV